MKECPRCGENKDLELFYVANNKPDKSSYMCMDCHNEATRKQAKTPKGKYVEYKSGAKKRGFIFTLTFDEFMVFWNKNCFYCGDTIDGIGLDRVDSSTGYSVENVESCCFRCNKMKATDSYSSFIERCRKIIQRHDSIE